MSNEIWVIADMKMDGSIRKVTFEALSEAKRSMQSKIGGPLCAVLMGSGVADKAEALGKYGAEKVYVVDNALLKRF